MPRLLWCSQAQRLSMQRHCLKRKLYMYIGLPTQYYAKTKENSAAKEHACIKLSILDKMEYMGKLLMTNRDLLTRKFKNALLKQFNRLCIQQLVEKYIHPDLPDMNITKKAASYGIPISSIIYLCCCAFFSKCYIR